MNGSQQQIGTLEQLETYFDEFSSRYSTIINARTNAYSWSGSDKSIANDVNKELIKIDGLCGSLPENKKRNDYGLYRSTLRSRILAARQQMEATLQAADRGH